jgi:predicted MPP superfamily phosphohydrolase
VFDETISRVNDLHPDYLLITGDFINDEPRDAYPLPKLLEKFNAFHGIYVSFGNHDHRRSIVATTRLLEQSGVHILNNSSVRTEEGVWLVGVDDYFEGEVDVCAAFAGVPENVTSILLSHNPSVFDFVSERDVVQLSGHTHGGQIALPFPTPRMVIKLHLRCNYVAGWYAKGSARLYVNRGLGVTGKPFRFRCPAEIAVFRLTGAVE